MPIALDKKKGGDRRLEKRGVKVRTASFEDFFLIILPHSFTFCLSNTCVSVYGKDRVGKNEKYSIGTVDRNKRADDLDTSIADKDGRAENPGIGIAVKNGRADNSGTSTVNRDGGADNQVQAK